MYTHLVMGLHDGGLTAALCCVMDQFGYFSTSLVIPSVNLYALIYGANLRLILKIDEIIVSITICIVVRSITRKYVLLY